MSFLPKLSQPTDVSHYRGTSLIDVFAKFYMAVLMVVLDTQGYVRGKGSDGIELNIFGEDKRTTSHAIVFMLVLLSRAYEWRGVRNVCCFEGDIKGAYDHLSLSLVEKALHFHKVPNRMIASILEEMVGLHMFPHLLGIDSYDNPSIPFNRCVRQGGVGSGKMWSAAIRSYFTLWPGNGTDAATEYSYLLRKDAMSRAQGRFGSPI